MALPLLALAGGAAARSLAPKVAKGVGKAVVRQAAIGAMTPAPKQHAALQPQQFPNSETPYAGG